MALIHGFGRHGGRLDEARAAFPLAPEPWIDLSTGVNPRAWRGPRPTRADLARLPDPLALRALERTAAAAFGLATPDRIAATAGAEAALRLLPAVTGAREVLIVGPTYGGHAEAWSASGARVREIALDELADVDCEAILVVNPNNPDGAMWPPAGLMELAARQAARGGWLIVDESFCDTRPQLSVASWAGDRLIVLRSFGKFYGLAGVRLGFALAEPALIARLRGLLGDWPVSVEAIIAGAAYADAAWAQRARRWLKRQAERLDSALVGAGLEIVGGSTLFRLARSPHAAAWFRHLAARGLLVRPFRDQPQWLRFGLPPAYAWPRLTQALEEFRP